MGIIRGTLLACVASCAIAASASAQTSCASLNGITLPLDGTASVVALSAFDVGPLTYGGLNIPQFCYVSMVISSNANPSQSQIQVLVGLPEGSAWNGRFVGTGNGGFAGAVTLSSPALYISQGYAAANTDMGTGLFKCNTLYCGSQEGTSNGDPDLGGLFGNPQAIRDFGYAATHLMTLAGKQLVSAFYGQAPAYSYFHGCSTGGNQALMEAQRFPYDYNGIVAGAPAYNRTHLHIAGAANYEATHFAPDALLTPAAMTLTHNAVLAACAGKDGGLATDTFLTQPNNCKFHAASLVCSGAPTDVPCTTANAGGCTCLTSNQASVLDLSWKAAVDANLRVLFPGLERGTEAVIASGNGGLLAQESLSEPIFDSLDYWAFGPSFQWQSLFRVTNKLAGILSSKIAALDATPLGNGDTFASVMNANNADITPFASHGGKLVMYAGYEDPLIPTASAIDYYNAVIKDDLAYPSYSRFYLAPGTLHCNGGDGANVFGNLSSTISPNLGNPAYDVFAAMTNWVELGAAASPGSVIATKFVNDDATQGVAFQRPLCPYPQTARYKGKGDATQAANWSCVSGALITNQPFNPIYGPH